jgi:hypothetical protein
MQTNSANAGFMDLNKASAAINAIPLVKESIPELMQLANGKVPGIPGYLALAKLQQIQQLVQSLAPNQPPQGTIKDNIEKSMATMMTQQGQQQQAQKAQMPQGGIGAFGPVPPNTPQPPMQAEAAPEMGPEQGAEPPMQAAHGGIMNAHVDPRMFNFDGGGIVSFAGGGPNLPGITSGTQLSPEFLEEWAKALPQDKAKLLERELQARATFRANPEARSVGQALRQGIDSVGDVVSKGLRKLPVGMLSKGLGALGLALEPSPIVDDQEILAARRGEGYKGQPYDPEKAQALLMENGMSPAQAAEITKRNIQEFIPPAPAPTSRPGQMTTANDPRTAFATAPVSAPRPAPGPAPVPTSGPMAPAPTIPGAAQMGAPQAPQTSDDAILALAKKLTLANPDAAQAKADREAAVPADFDQAKAIADQQKLNEALGIGTYAKNRREQLGQLKKEFEANQPTNTDRLLASARAFSRPGARAGDMSEASYKMIEAERTARLEFARAQDLATDAIEKADEAVRTGDAVAIRAAKAEATKAKQAAMEKKAELSQKVADNTSASQRQGVSSAAQITDARERDQTMLTTARMNNVSAEKVAGMHYAATKYAADKPDAGERILNRYIEIKNKNGEAEANKFLEDNERVRAAVLGIKFTGVDKTIENRIKLDDLIRKETEDVDRRLASSSLTPEKRKLLEAERKIRVDRVRNNYPELAGTTMSTQDQQALEWANNPNSPKWNKAQADAIKQRLGQ